MMRTSITGTRNNMRSPCNNIRRSNDAGFTFVEVLVVLFIITLAFALAFPSFEGMGSRGSLKNDAKTVASILRAVSDAAAAAKQTYPLTFDFDEKQLKWETSEGNRTKRIKSLLSVQLSSQGVIHEGELTVLFEPLGAREHLFVHLQAKGQQIMTVSINPLSRRVKILSEAQGGG